MKKLVVFLFVITMVMPVKAQFALKGGVAFDKDVLSNYVVTGQFYQDLLVVSGDLFIPTQKDEKLSGAGRVGIGLGYDRFRFAADIGATYEDDKWRCGFGVEGNLRLYGPIGMFVRYSQMYPISKDDHNEVKWKCKRSEVSVGIVTDLVNGRCY